MNNNINEIISRVLSGEASSDEIQLLLKWFQENEENSKEFARYEKLWNALEIISKSNKYDSQRAYQKFKDYLDGTLSVEKPVSILSRLSRIAALVIFTSGLAFFGRLLSESRLRPIR
ncbi:MAG: hypothetical protein HC830_10695 [Bacteroidetes bacterium]|nr:hypothetical protein [Bacteroidota bacterium]